MIQLLCDGTFLDLPEDVKISFTNVNPLFAFDSISCERSTEFSIPSTPKNERVFGLAKRPEYAGSRMRQKFDAQMVCGIVVKNGYLYVDSFKDGNYKAIFVTGQLIGLQQMRNAAKLPELIKPTDEEVYLDGGSSPWSANGLDYTGVKYIREDRMCIPSAKMSHLATLAANALGVNISLPSNADKLRIFNIEISGLKATQLTIKRYAQNEYVVEGSGTPKVLNRYNIVADGSMDNFLWTDTAKMVSYRVQNTDEQTDTLYVGYAFHYKATQNIELTFPDDWDDNVFVGRFTGNWLSTTPSAFEFIGDRSLTYDQVTDVVTIVGDSLRGRIVQINKGDIFTFVHKNDYVHEEVDRHVYKYGWDIVALDLISKVSIAHSGDVENGDYVRLRDNLPDISAIDLFKSIAYLSGTALNYTDEDGVFFDAITISDWDVLDLSGKVLSFGTIQRTFGNYAQRNIIRFNSDDLVVDNVTAEYRIANDNIEAETELYQIPYTEGNISYDDSASLGSRYGVAFEEGSSGIAIGDCDVPIINSYMSRASIPTNSGITSICNASTKIEVSVSMTLAEYERIKPNMRILINGNMFVWVSAKYSQGVVQLTLQRI